MAITSTIIHQNSHTNLSTIAYWSLQLFAFSAIIFEAGSVETQKHSRMRRPTQIASFLFFLTYMGLVGFNELRSIDLSTF